MHSHFFEFLGKNPEKTRKKHVYFSKSCCALQKNFVVSHIESVFPREISISRDFLNIGDLQHPSPVSAFKMAPFSL